MNRENYVKPVVDVLELSDDIVLASGCVDIGGCTSDDSCPDICESNCGTGCTDNTCPSDGCSSDS